MYEIEQIVIYVLAVIFLFCLGLFFVKKEQTIFGDEVFSKGTATFVVVLFLLNYHFNLSIRKIYVGVLLLAVLAVGTYVYRKIKFGKEISVNRTWIIGIALGGGIVLAQTVVYQTLNPWLDTYTYITCADYMLEHGWKDTVLYQEYYPWTTQVLWYQDWGLRVGGQQMMAFFTALMRKELSFDVLIPCLAIGTILTGCGMVRFTRVILEKYIKNNSKIYVAEISICLFAIFNGFLFLDPFEGFYPMTLGSAFFLLTVSEIVIAMNQKCERKNVIWGIVYACCLAITYSELLPFLALQTLCLLGVKAYQEKKIWNDFTKYIVIIVFCSIIFLNVYTFDAIKAVLMEMKDRVGTNSRKREIIEYIGYILGTMPMLYSFHSDSNPLLKLLYLVLTLLVSIWLVRLFGRYAKKKPLFEIVGLYVPFLIMIMYFNYFAVNLWEEGTGNSYSIYKTMRYCVLLLLPWISILLNQFYMEQGRVKKIIVCAYLSFAVVIGGGYIIQNYKMCQSSNSKLFNAEGNYFEEYYKLRNRYVSENRTINLVEVPGAHARLVTYFLKECRISYPYKDDIFHRKYVDHNPEYDSSGVTLLYMPSADNTIAGMVEINNDYYETVLQDGFYVEETLNDGDKFCWSQKESYITISRPIALADVVDVNFDIYLSVPNQKSAIAVYDVESGEKLKTIDINTNGKEPFTVKFELDMGQMLERKLKLCFTGEVPLNNTRELAYMILLNDNIKRTVGVQ